jgi:hypothetical protein
LVQEHSAQEERLREELVPDESSLDGLVQQVSRRRRFPDPQRHNRVLRLTAAKVADVQWWSEVRKMMAVLVSVQARVSLHQR